MSLPEQIDHVSPGRAATATYNFVPLPELVVPAVSDARDLPPHDTYAVPGHPHTGYFDVTLTTRSPLYVRGMLSVTAPAPGRSESEWETAEAQKGAAAAQAGFRTLMKNKPEFFAPQDPSHPVLPGSSLHGMLRGVLEIASYGKVDRVSARTNIYYRAVAASDEDPLKRPYAEVIGKFGANVRAGYLRRHGGDWYVRPAKRPASGNYLTVKARDIAPGLVPGLLRFDDPNYRPGRFPVHFEDSVPAPRLVAAGTPAAKAGVLVCSGNMLETGGAARLLRRKHALVLEPNPKAVEIKISPQAVEEYTNSLTAFQRKFYDNRTGCLADGQPLFYVDDAEISQFGHSPNFRAAARTESFRRAATPMQFVPPHLRRPLDVDYPDALFGFVRRRRDFAGGNVPLQGDPRRGYAGRVSVTDAVLIGDPPPDRLWLLGDPHRELVPAILASPQVTPFQHVLVQSSEKKRDLRHWSSLTPDETVLRGSKRYWLQGDRTAEQLGPAPGSPGVDAQGRVEAGSTQHTRLSPVRSGNAFRFRVYFENLSDAEMGALCWALHPAGEEGRDYCHSLGMGKPLGMGAVALDAVLHLTDRRTRYRTLFTGGRWTAGRTGPGTPLSDKATLDAYIRPFEETILTALGLGGKGHCLRDVERISILLRMMEWTDTAPSFVRQMTLDEFGQQRVLPSPKQYGGVDGVLRPDLPATASALPAAPAALPEPTAADIAAAEQMLANMRKKREKERTTNAAVSTPKNDGQMFAQVVQGNKPRVRLPSGEVISCDKLNPYAAPTWAEGWCLVMVTPLGGKPLKAEFKRWQKQGEIAPNSSTGG